MKTLNEQLSVIGSGRVGKTIARLVNDKTDISIGTLINTTQQKSIESVKFVGGGSTGNFSENLSDACTDLVLISTPDDQIGKTADSISASGHSFADTVIFHCSGSLSSTELSSLQDKGASVASVHPLMSFSSPEDAILSFEGTYCAVEGDSPAVKKLTTLFTQLGGVVFPIATESKVLYHAAATITCNYLYTLMDIGFCIFDQIGIPAETTPKLLAPLLQSTLDNALRSGPKEALTGPIVRGEHAVVKAHLAKLQTLDPLYADAYSTLGKITANMAFETASISEETKNTLYQQLAKSVTSN